MEFEFFDEDVQDDYAFAAEDISNDLMNFDYGSCGLEDKLLVELEFRCEMDLF
ncbi:hypothetical protein HanHA300_Chr02g0058771 [Helianthus annuus]|nr:hypothetical protein HanHA300_Chr02g0058771 [Helianthus annuus]KAJ0777531.1 hypothetical protein HanLR1_Chr02g0061511 [Helianthus annuus]